MPDVKLEPIVVLLVDDQAFVGAAVGRLLAAEPDISLHCCRSALDAVAAASQLNPAIIFQDLVMPDIDGLTLVGLFRANPATAHTPVVVLSGNDDADVRARALAQGADDYLVKLPAKDDLIACIRRYGAPGGAGRAANGPGAADAAPRPLHSDQTLDLSVLAVFREADAPGSSLFSRTLIEQFLEEAAVQIQTLNDAAVRSDLPALEAIAHSLRGSALTIGANRLGVLCAQIERHGAKKSEGVAVEVLMAELEREFTRVQAALEPERQDRS